MMRGAEQTLSETGLQSSANVPNAETVEAIQEVRRMQTDPGLGKTYTDVNQMMAELLADV